MENCEQFPTCPQDKASNMENEVSHIESFATATTRKTRKSDRFCIFNFDFKANC